ncbi:MAG: toxic anion resistance protein [Thermoleophilia bacterium]
MSDEMQGRGAASDAPAGDEAAGLKAAAETPAAGPLSPADLARVAEVSAGVDVSDAQSVLSFGLPAQSRIATFADSLLGDVRNKDAGTGGEALRGLLKKVRELDIDALSAGTGKARIPIIGRFTDTFERFSTRYQKVATSIERILDAMERSRMALLKDMTVLDKMYELNLDYLKQLDVYIAAGGQALRELHSVKIPALEAEAAGSGDVMAAQRLTDLQQATARFERRLHDLKLTRLIAIQTAPQIRLIQANDQNLVEKIQNSILATVPLWKNQIVVAISLYRQQKAVTLQQEVTDTTNELLAKNAELLKSGSAKVGREVERGIVDIETLQKVNADLVATLEETIRIQEESRARRFSAEGEIGRLQMELRQKLLELKSPAPQLGSGDAPPRLME